MKQEKETSNLLLMVANHIPSISKYLFL